MSPFPFKIGAAFAWCASIILVALLVTVIVHKYAKQPLKVTTLQVSAEYLGGTTMWYVHVNLDGLVVVRRTTLQSNKEFETRIDRRRVSELIDKITDIGFFQMQPELGDRVPSGAIREITVVLNDQK